MSLQKRIQSFRHAFRGLFLLFRSQANARIHLIAAIVVVAAGFYFQVSRTEWIALVLCIGTVVALEAVNTAVEFLTDLVSPEWHPLAGKTKDVAAAAVLVAAVAAAVVGLLVFAPKIL
jgi:diacylglycerol kinase